MNNGFTDLVGCGDFLDCDLLRFAKQDLCQDSTLKAFVAIDSLKQPFGARFSSGIHPGRNKLSDLALPFDCTGGLPPPKRRNYPWGQERGT
jgi:hypothetical protein